MYFRAGVLSSRRSSIALERQKPGAGWQRCSPPLPQASISQASIWQARCFCILPLKSIRKANSSPTTLCFSFPLMNGHPEGQTHLSRTKLSFIISIPPNEFVAKSTLEKADPTTLRCLVQVEEFPIPQTGFVAAFSWSEVPQNPEIPRAQRDLRSPKRFYHWVCCFRIQTKEFVATFRLEKVHPRPLRCPGGRQTF